MEPPVILKLLYIRHQLLRISHLVVHVYPPAIQCEAPNVDSSGALQEEYKYKIQQIIIKYK